MIVRFMCLLLGVSIFLSASPIAPPPAGVHYQQSMEQEILVYVNADRKSLGLPALRMNDIESGIAAKHSKNMATGKVAFGHDGLNARAKAIQKQVGEVHAVGENVASGQMNAREVVDGWLKSPGHKKNIEGDFALTGIGYAKDRKGVIYFTQIFSK